jgi:hypothetical protein
MRIRPIPLLIDINTFAQHGGYLGKASGRKETKMRIHATEFGTLRRRLPRNSTKIRSGILKATRRLFFKCEALEKFPDQGYEQSPHLKGGIT